MTSGASSMVGGAHSTIEFRIGTRGVPWDSSQRLPTAEVVIDSVPLSERFKAAGSGGYAVTVGVEVSRSLSVWTSNPPAESEAPDGFVPVLTCGCGFFDCGGSYARIVFDASTVVWTDFHDEPSYGGRSVDVGPFTFDRSQYEQALRRPAARPDR